MCEQDQAAAQDLQHLLQPALRQHRLQTSLTNLVVEVAREAAPLQTKPAATQNDSLLSTAVVGGSARGVGRPRPLLTRRWRNNSPSGPALLLVQEVVVSDPKLKTSLFINHFQILKSQQINLEANVKLAPTLWRSKIKAICRQQFVNYCNKNKCV